MTETLIVVSDRAIKETIEWEARRDGPWRQGLKEQGLTEEWFLEFGAGRSVGYGVVRNLRTGSRTQALQLIDRHLVRRLNRRTQSTPPAALVDEVAARLAVAGFTAKGRRPVFMVSKIASMVRPDIYVPYDSYARDTLSRAGYVPGIGDYAQYRSAFTRAFAGTRRELITTLCREKWHTITAAHGLAPSLLGAEWFQERVFDWELWLQGKARAEAKGRSKSRKRTKPRRSPATATEAADWPASSDGVVQAIVRDTGNRFTDGTPVWFVALPKALTGSFRPPDNSHKEMSFVVPDSNYRVRLIARTAMPEIIWFQRIRTLDDRPARLTDVLRKLRLSTNDRFLLQVSESELRYAGLPSGSSAFFRAPWPCLSLLGRTMIASPATS